MAILRCPLSHMKSNRLAVREVSALREDGRARPDLLRDWGSVGGLGGGAFVVEGEQTGEDFVAGEVRGPAVGGEDGFV